MDKVIHGDFRLGFFPLAIVSESHYTEIGKIYILRRVVRRDKQDAVALRGAVKAVHQPFQRKPLAVWKGRRSMFALDHHEKPVAKFQKGINVRGRYLPEPQSTKVADLLGIASVANNAALSVVQIMPPNTMPNFENSR